MTMEWNMLLPFQKHHRLFIRLVGDPNENPHEHVTPFLAIDQALQLERTVAGISETGGLAAPRTAPILQESLNHQNAQLALVRAGQPVLIGDSGQLLAPPAGKTPIAGLLLRYGAAGHVLRKHARSALRTNATASRRA